MRIATKVMLTVLVLTAFTLLVITSFYTPLNAVGLSFTAAILAGITTLAVNWIWDHKDKVD